MLILTSSRINSGTELVNPPWQFACVSDDQTLPILSEPRHLFTLIFGETLVSPSYSTGAVVSLER